MKGDKKTLSDEIVEDNWNMCAGNENEFHQVEDFLHAEDVKQFIKDLKDRLNLLIDDDGAIEYQYIERELDKLAGDKLK